jgi:hypothetical protein
LRGWIVRGLVAFVLVTAVLGYAGPEFVRLLQAQREVGARTQTAVVARAFGLESLARPGLNLAAKTAGPIPLRVAPMSPRTVVSIEGQQFLINGKPTYMGRVWNQLPIEGLLFNVRAVQATFDDWDPEGKTVWAYPDTGVWDRDRNTSEFLAAMPSWRDHGLAAITVNLQGGNAHAPKEGWVNSAFDASGELHPAYFDRMRSVIEKADSLGMVVVLGLFYFRNDEVLRDEDAVKHAVDRTVDWLHDLGARNVLIEISNECDIRAYDHAILRCDRIHELIERAAHRERSGYRFLVSSSLQGGSLPPAEIVEKSDYVILHGNGVSRPERITAMINDVRAGPVYRPMPIVFNEDDNYDFDKPINNFVAATMAYASWGYFDRRYRGDPFEAGFQSVPVDWKISHERKRAFFNLLAEITGAQPAN